MKILVALIALLAACDDKKPDPCEPAKQAAIKALDTARTSTLAKLADTASLQTKVIEKRNAAKEASRMFVNQMDEIWRHHGCDDQDVCCSKPRPIDGLENAPGIVDVDLKDFRAAVAALGKASGTARAGACATVNAEIDRVKHGQTDVLRKRVAETQAAFDAGEAEIKALEADRKHLDDWHAKMPTGKPTWLEEPAPNESATVKQVRGALEAYNTVCMH